MIRQCAVDSSEGCPIGELEHFVVGSAVPAGPQGGAGCVLGLFGRAFDEEFPPFPSCDDVEALLRQLRVRLSRQVIKSIVVANDGGQIEEAWQLLVDARRRAARVGHPGAQ
jgi:hypothetical protein